MSACSYIWTWRSATRSPYFHSENNAGLLDLLWISQVYELLAVEVNALARLAVFEASVLKYLERLAYQMSNSLLWDRIQFLGLFITSSVETLDPISERDVVRHHYNSWSHRTLASGYVHSWTWVLEPAKSLQMPSLSWTSVLLFSCNLWNLN